MKTRKLVKVWNEHKGRKHIKKQSQVLVLGPHKKEIGRDPYGNLGVIPG